MRKFANNEKINGEMAVRGMSDKAQEFYAGTDMADVWEYEEDGVKMYALDLGDGIKEGLTIKSIEETFEELKDMEDGDVW